MRALTTTSSVRSWFDVDAYTGGWFDDDLIPPPGATPPVTPTTAPRRWAIGSMRLITGRKVH